MNFFSGICVVFLDIFLKFHVWIGHCRIWNFKNRLLSHLGIFRWNFSQALIFNCSNSLIETREKIFFYKCKRKKIIRWTPTNWNWNLLKCLRALLLLRKCAVRMDFVCRIRNLMHGCRFKSDYKEKFACFMWRMLSANESLCL